MAYMEKLKTAADNLPAGVRAILAHTGKPRSLLCDEPIRNVIHEGVAGFELSVNLTSYRALPLSCIEGLQFEGGRGRNGCGHGAADLERREPQTRGTG